jgi:hypothetical protein
MNHKGLFGRATTAALLTALLVTSDREEEYLRRSV